MKLFTMTALLIASIGVTAQEVQSRYSYKIVKVSDGDTVQFAAPFMAKNLGLKPVLSLRVLGVDTPEKAPRHQCDAENEAAQAASAFTKHAIDKAKVIELEVTAHDKYGGRVLGDVFLDGKRLSEMLIANGFARPYHGEKKSSWCD